MDTQSDETRSIRPRRSARRWAALGCTAALSAGLVPALSPGVSYAGARDVASAPWTGSVLTTSTTRRQTLRTTTATLKAALVLEVAVPQSATYVAELTFSGLGTKRSSVTVEGTRVAVARNQKVLRVTVPVTDGRLTAEQPASSTGPALTSVTATLQSPLASPSPVTSPTTSPAPAPAPVPTTAPARDLSLHPFASNSVWNLPIGTAATFESVTSPRTASLHTIGSPWANEGQYSHPVVRATTNDPMATVTDVRDSSRSGTYRIPATAPIAAGTDRHLHVVNPEGTIVDEAWDMTRVSTTEYRVGRREAVDLRGSGIGPSNGTRAYGGSAIGGLIRAWEVDPTHPKYTGRIEHALAIALRSDQLLYTGGTSGYSGGYGTAKGYVWPATEQDWDSPSSYKGAVPMGAYVAIPGHVDLATLGLSPQGLMLARAYQDYGAYVTDRSGEPILAYVEPSAAGRAFTTGLLGPNWSASDLVKIRAQLRVVSNNTATTPNGAPLGGSRRAPLLP